MIKMNFGRQGGPTSSAAAGGVVNPDAIITDWRAFKWCACYVAIIAIFQIFIGAQISVVMALSLASLLGVLAGAVGGGIKTIVGALCYIHVTKVVLVSLFLKSVLMEPLESNLLAPQETSNMLVIGYMSLLAAAALMRVMISRESYMARGLYSRVLPRSPNYVLALGISFLIVGLASSVIAAIFSHRLGGGLGGLRLLGQFKGFSIACFVFYMHLIGSKRLLINPLVIISVVLLTMMGVAGATKQGMLEPFLFAGLAYYSIRGFQWKRYLLVGIVGFLFAQYVVHPFSQNAKMALLDRDQNTKPMEVVDFFIKSTMDSSVREENAAKLREMRLATEKSYFDADVNMLNRVCMIYEQSWLVEASKEPSARTGWYTITWALEMLTPRFLNPGKPFSSSAPWLGSFSGMTAANDEVTSISFGYMANFYHAFGYLGVLVGGFFLPLVFFTLLSFCFGYNPRRGLLWVFGVAAFHHGFVEAVLGSLLPMLYIPFYFGIYCVIGWGISQMIPARMERGSPRRRTA